ncbi:GNAT family protein [Actinoplanes sp. NPDC051851]|uniref:GNAT family N-acetyltransferase n=1 Tax=Actinoplanes sp. NPDC051851 TaxID=3154753 RepID=UPI00342304E0
MDIDLRPLREGDLDMMRRFTTEPGLIGLDWRGFRDAGAVARRFAEDGYLSPSRSSLIVSADAHTAGVVDFREAHLSATPSMEIGIVLLPEFRGRGIGWRAQVMLCDYLFTHYPIHRIQAGTHDENLAEQNALRKAGFTREGVIRAAEFRDGAYHDGVLYSRLRTDPTPPGLAPPTETPGLAPPTETPGLAPLPEAQGLASPPESRR